MKGLIYREVELERAEHTNEHGVTTINRLIEHYKESPETGKKYEISYTWYQTIGGSYAVRFSTFKTLKRMRQDMEKYGF